MQYEKPQVTKLSIRSDMATSISSSQHGANLDAIGFNVNLLLTRRPLLAVDLMRLYHEARDIFAEAPVAPAEDFHVAEESFQRLHSLDAHD